MATPIARRLDYNTPRDAARVAELNPSLGRVFGLAAQTPMTGSVMADRGRRLRARLRAEAMGEDLLSPDEVAAENSDIGLTVNTPIARAELGILRQNRIEDLARQQQIAQSTSPLAIGASLAGGFAATVSDPVEVASMFVPIVGPTTRAQMIARRMAAGATRAQAQFRTSMRAGMIEGAVGNAAIEPIYGSLARDAGLDYGMADALFSVGAGAIFGGAIGAAGGWRAARRIMREERARAADPDTPPEELGTNVHEMSQEDRRQVGFALMDRIARTDEHINIGEILGIDDADLGRMRELDDAVTVRTEELRAQGVPDYEVGFFEGLMRSFARTQFARNDFDFARTLDVFPEAMSVRQMSQHRYMLETVGRMDSYVRTVGGEEVDFVKLAKEGDHRSLAEFLTRLGPEEAASVIDDLLRGARSRPAPDVGRLRALAEGLAPAVDSVFGRLGRLRGVTPEGRSSPGNRPSSPEPAPFDGQLHARQRGARAEALNAVSEALRSRSLTDEHADAIRAILRRVSAEDIKRLADIIDGPGQRSRKDAVRAVEARVEQSNRRRVEDTLLGSQLATDATLRIGDVDFANWDPRLSMLEKTELLHTLTVQQLRDALRVFRALGIRIEPYYRKTKGPLIRQVIQIADEFSGNARFSSERQAGNLYPVSSQFAGRYKSLSREARSVMDDFLPQKPFDAARPAALDGLLVRSSTNRRYISKPVADEMTEVLMRRRFPSRAKAHAALVQFMEDNPDVFAPITPQMRVPARVVRQRGRPRTAENMSIADRYRERRRRRLEREALRANGLGEDFAVGDLVVWRTAKGGGFNNPREILRIETGEDGQRFAFVRGSSTGIPVGELRDPNVSRETEDLLQLAGPRAQTANADLLSRAKEMRSEGRSPDEIWQETGWARTRNGWRFEIDPDKFQIKPADEVAEYIQAGGRRVQELIDGGGPRAKMVRAYETEFPYKEYSLEDFIEFDELFAAYPQLRGARVAVRYTESAFAAFSFQGIFRRQAVFRIGAHEAKDIAPRLRHEIAHLIQRIEGARGGTNTRADSLEGALRYASNIGENEAVNVELRSQMSPEDRARLAPNSTQIFDDELQGTVNMDTSSRFFDQARTAEGYLDRDEFPAHISRREDMDRSYGLDNLTRDPESRGDLLQGRDIPAAERPGILADLFRRMARAFDDDIEEIRVTDDAFDDAMSTLQPRVQGPPRPETRTEAFRRWFRGSFVTTADGDPQFMYHGRIRDFGAFDKRRQGDRFGGDQGAGFLFTDNTRTASGYAGGEGGNVMPVYLAVKRPLIVNREFLASTGRLADEYQADPLIEIWDKHGRALAREARRGGHDGVILELDFPHRTPLSDAEAARTQTRRMVSVFEPNQIKSAIGNRGRFDPNNPDVLAQGRSRGVINGAFDRQTGRIRLFETRDPSTLVHETGHYVLEYLDKMARRAGAPEELRTELETVYRWMSEATGESVRRFEDISVRHHEAFAEAFEKWTASGRAPHVLQRIFEQLKDFLLNLAQIAKQRRYTFSPEVEEFLKRQIAQEKRYDLDSILSGGRAANEPRPPRAPSDPLSDAESAPRPDRADGDDALAEFKEATVRRVEAAEASIEPDELARLDEGFTSAEVNAQFREGLASATDAAARAMASGERGRAAIIDAAREALGEMPDSLPRSDIDPEIERMVDDLIAAMEESAGDLFQFMETVATRVQTLRADAEHAKWTARLNRAILIENERTIATAAREHKRPGLGILAILGGVNRTLHGGRDSADARGNAMSSMMVGGLISRLEDGGLLRDARSGKLDLLIARELENLSAREPVDGGVTGNDAAFRIAQIYRLGQEAQRRELNRVGARIGQLENYIGPQAHDIRAMRKNRREWFGLMRKHVDWVRTLPDARGTPEEIEDFLMSAYDALTSGVHGSAGRSSDITTAFRGPSNVARKWSEHRLIHFKNAASWMEYRTHFGMRGTLLDMILAGADKAGRSVGLMERLGTNPSAMYDRMVQRARRKYVGQDVPTWEGLFGASSKAETTIGTAQHDALMREIEGASTSVVTGGEVFAELGSVVRSIQGMAKLGSAVISAVSDVATMVSEMRLHGYSTAEAIAQIPRAFRRGLETKSEMREMMRAAGIGIDVARGAAISRYESGDGVNARLQKTGAFFYWMTGLTGWTDWQRRGLVTSISSLYAGRAGQQFSELDPRTRTMLQQYGIDRDMWDAIRKEGLVNHAGDEIIDFRRLFELSSAAREARNDLEADRLYAAGRQWQMFLLDVAEMGVLQPGARERAMTTMGYERGTVARELFGLMMQFKQFPLAILNRSMGRQMQMAPNRVSTIQNLGFFLASTSLLGIAAYQMKEWAKGRESVDPLDPKLWVAGVLQGGGLGIFGDFIIGRANRFGNSALETAAGPTFGALATGSNLLSGFFHGTIDPDDRPGWGEVIHFLRGNTPFANVLWYKAALDYAIFFNLQEMASPGYLTRMERRLRRDSGGREYFAPPSEIIPRGGQNMAYNAVTAPLQAAGNAILGDALK